MKFYKFALLFLALVSLATISKAQIGDIIDDIGKRENERISCLKV